MPDQEHRMYDDYGKLHTTRECPECEGVGEVKCTCDCGNEHENPCDTCDGHGWVKK